jgi:dephospho-CoA kinase
MSKPVIGLIGGIGSGKSQVAAEFVRRGGFLISGDQLGHEALRQPPILARVVEQFGNGVLDDQGAISRRRLGAIVFADPEKRKALERLVFPWIEKRFAQESARAWQDPAVTVIVFDAAILLEAGWDDRCDLVVYVNAPREVRLDRLARQRGWSAKEVAARESAQLYLTDKVTRADAVIDNSGPLEELSRQVDRLLGSWEQARRKPYANEGTLKP